MQREGAGRPAADAEGKRLQLDHRDPAGLAAAPRPGTTADQHPGRPASAAEYTTVGAPGAGGPPGPAYNPAHSRAWPRREALGHPDGRPVRLPVQQSPRPVGDRPRGAVLRLDQARAAAEAPPQHRTSSASRFLGEKYAADKIEKQAAREKKGRQLPRGRTHLRGRGNGPAGRRHLPRGPGVDGRGVHPREGAGQGRQGRRDVPEGGRLQEGGGGLGAERQGGQGRAPLRGKGQQPRGRAAVRARAAVGQGGRAVREERLPAEGGGGVREAGRPHAGPPSPSRSTSSRTSPSPRATRAGRPPARRGTRTGRARSTSRRALPRRPARSTCAGPSSRRRRRCRPGSASSPRPRSTTCARETWARAADAFEKAGDAGQGRQLSRRGRVQGRQAPRGGGRLPGRARTTSGRRSCSSRSGC